MDAGSVMGQSDNLPESSFYVGRNEGCENIREEKIMVIAIGYVQVKHSGSVCVVKTKICPEHRVPAKNYSVEVEVDEATAKIVRTDYQDYAASAGECKHSVAVIMWLHRISEEPAAVML